MSREEQIGLFIKKSVEGIEDSDTRTSAAITLAAGIHWADSHPHWIPVEEELPPENGKTQQSISVWATNGLMSGEFRYNFDTKTWTDMWGDPFDITHWMPIPQPPRKEDKE